MHLYVAEDLANDVRSRDTIDRALRAGSVPSGLNDDVPAARSRCGKECDLKSTTRVFVEQPV